MWRRILILGILFLSLEMLSAEEYNQLYLEHDTYVDLEEDEPFEIDNSLFRVYVDGGSDLYEEVTRYIYTPISTKRRGVDWWQLSRIESTTPTPFSQPTDNLSVGLSASTSGYRASGNISWSRQLGRGWGVDGRAYLYTGRDMNIEGVFRNDIYPSLTLAKDFGADHNLSLTVKVPYKMRGLRSSATQECYDLTHNNLYNPSWGYYHGEVRNSRVQRNLLPSFRGDYKRALGGGKTTMWADLSFEYGTRKVSRLGWYDSYNPMPNYYSKMPSEYAGTSSYESIAEAWQQNNTDYTQVAWDKLEQINLSSADGESHYVVEDRVERVADVGVHALFATELEGGFRVWYGANIDLYNHRNYKQMRDLLGGEYLLDIDQYAGDYVQVGNEMQNDLRNPNRKITTGDRFGYDFDHLRRSYDVMAKGEYRTSLIQSSLSVSVGEVTILRDGHYEKERFSGSASYGESPKITLPTYNISAEVGYAIAANHSISLCMDIDAEAPLSRYLFVADQNSNRIIDSPESEKIISATLNYRYSTSEVSFVAQGYIISVRDGVQVWQGYDDLSSAYCDIVISEIATRSLGVELSGKVNLGRRIKLTSSLSAGGYTYSSAPLVTLYDDTDLSLVAQSQATTMKGKTVGNTPQISTTAGVTYCGRKGFILSAEVAYYACRYIAPSIVRRTDRVVSMTTSPELYQSVTSQERLPNLFNANISMLKSFTVGGEDRVAVALKVNNLFGSNNIISSAREANRVLSNYDNDTLYGYNTQASTYEYGVSRVVNISVRYRF